MPSESALLDANSALELIYSQVLEYLSAEHPHSAVHPLVAFVTDEVAPLEALLAIADASISELARAWVEALGHDGAVDRVRGYLLHNELSRIEHSGGNL